MYRKEAINLSKSMGCIPVIFLNYSELGINFEAIYEMSGISVTAS